MSLHDTSRQRETGGISPFAVSDSMDFAALQEGAEIIDSTPGTPGAVTVRRTPGQIRYDERLTDAVAQYEQPPGVTIKVVHGRRKS